MSHPEIVPQEGSFIGSHPMAVAAAVTVVLLLVTIRAFSGSSSSRGNGSRTPGMPGYWLPYFGHVPELLFSASSLLANSRQRYTEGIFSLKLFGATHNILYRPSLVAAFLDPEPPSGDATWLSRRLLRSVFGLSQKDMAIYDRLRPELETQSRSLLTNDSIQHTLKQLRNQVADFISFNSYPADQMEWERMADADAVKDENGENAMQVDLTELVKHFGAGIVSGAQFGTDFVENFPEFWQMLWAVDKGFIPLALNTPSWLPWPSAQRARTARRKLLSFTYEFHAALDKYLSGVETDARWQDLDNVGPLVLARAKLLREHGMSIEGRAICDMALAWDINSKTCMLISWMLFELYRDPVFLAQVREEVRPFVKAIQPKNDFGPAVWVPPEIESADPDGLATSCPLLRAAYLETLRLYGTDWVTRWLPEDTVLKDSDAPNKSYLLRKGTCVHVPAEVHNLDPAYFPDAHDWRATRHLQEKDEDKPKTKVAENVLVRTDSECVTVRKPESLQIREVLLFTAALISVYDIEPPKGQHWKNPKTKRSATVRQPSRRIKVWIKRRDLTTGA